MELVLIAFLAFLIVFSLGCSTRTDDRRGISRPEDSPSKEPDNIQKWLKEEREKRERNQEDDDE